MDEFEWVKSFSTSSYGTVSHLISREIEGGDQEQPNSSQAPLGSFASFICHVIHLERKLRAFTPIVLDTSSSIRATAKILGQGKTFLVRHAQWVQKPNEPPIEVALKEIIPTFQSTDETSSTSFSSINRPQNDWKDILFELRALLHEPIRYHPNLVRLLGIQWGLSPLSESTYPMLVMECSSIGTLRALQSSVEPLSFSTKQKLGYDVGRALYALHACGIVHGDMKHENVLIFPNKEAKNTGVQYTAKLADFGGSVMDMTEEEFRKMETWTWPFQAPEIDSDKPLTRNGMMLTDVYSFGLLIWRLFTDGEGFVSLPGATQSASDEAKRALVAQKAEDDFTNVAIANVYEYAVSHSVPQSCVDLIVYTILHTIRLNPSDRNLVKAQAALRGIKLGKINTYIGLVRKRNEEREATEASGAPGRHGITRDSLQFMLGRYGNDVDLQDNLPGFRPRLSEPDVEEFLFEPENLKTILTWNQQRQMLGELKDTAGNTGHTSTRLLGMRKTVAAFYLFQCYLLEFGTEFDATEAVKWLLVASSNDDSHEDADYLAQAWIWRISRSLDVSINLSTERLNSLLQLSVIRGHRTCLEDLLTIVGLIPNNHPVDWMDTFKKSKYILLSQMGGVGMGYFFSSFMTKTFNLFDMDQLDEQIRLYLGVEYESCLKTSMSSVVDALAQNKDEEKTAFDRIYVNRRGHGLLHYAAATGNLNALQHMITKYRCDVNLPNQHVDEPPLICACEGGKVDCTLFLLDNGADPNGYRHGQEGGLHWLSSFDANDMEKVASRLVAAGADIELRSNGMRHDVRGVRADWEHTLEIVVTPLGRAVLMNNLEAVKVLLKLGADPLATTASKHSGQYQGMKDTTQVVKVSSAFDLAAVLTFPDMIEEFIKHIDGRQDTLNYSMLNRKLLDEASMLDLARGRKVTKHDPLSLQSRLVRCGPTYQKDLQRTIALLHARALPWHSNPGDELKEKRARIMCREVSLGSVDVVKCLLELDYDPNGTDDFRPLEQAVKLNHEALFALLATHKAAGNITRPTPAGYISILHMCASRPRQSRPGHGIANAIIRSGVPIESVDRRSRSPLAMAILNQNFDVARALIEHGADINVIYPVQLDGIRGPENHMVSLLVEVLAQHTMRTVESLKFLFGKQDGGPRQIPHFTIDNASNFSILHLLAGSEQFTEIAQITPLILNLCLDTYSDADLINYKHPLLGTPLYYAAVNGNKAMVERLLSRGANTNISAGPDISDSIQTLLRPQETWTPLWAAILRYDDELKKCAVASSGNSLDVEGLKSGLMQNLEKVLEFLKSEDDTLAKEAMRKLAEKKEKLVAKLAKARGMQRNARRDSQVGQGDVPINLSNLSGQGDEKVDKELEDVLEEDWVPSDFREVVTSLAQGSRQTAVIR